MNKQMFCKEIKTKLKDFNLEEVDGIVEYYVEIIDEKIEAGFTEEDAIASFGSIDNHLNRIKADLVLERSKEVKPKFLRNSLIILGICSTPILVPIGIAFFVVFFTVLMTLGISFLAFGISSVGILVSTVAMIVEMVASGTGLGEIFVIVGLALIVSSIFGAIAVAIYKLGRWSLNQINKLFSKLIQKRTKNKEVNYV